MDNQQHPKYKDFKDDAQTFAEVEEFVERKETCLNDGLGSRLKFWRRRRYIVVTMVLLGEITKLILRSNLSIAVFPMTENYTIYENGTKIFVQDFDWDVKTRSFLLSVFYYGYVSTNVVGGILAVKYGGGKLFGLGVILTSITTLCTPFVARIHLYMLIAIRIFEGFCEGILNPCGELLLSKWVPSAERSTSTAVTVSGNFWGHIISIAMSSWIGYHWGWEAIFYCTGAVGVLWFVAWWMIVKERPELDKNILLSELTYIQDSTRRNQQLICKVSDIPYLKIMISSPVWALIIAYFVCSWVHITSITLYPAYIKDVLKLEYQNSGYLSSVPFIVSVLSTYILSPIADLLIARNIWTLTKTRKMYVSGGLTITAIFSFVIQHATSATSVILCLTVLQMFITVCYAQYAANMIDMAPKYSSILSGITSTSISLCGIFAPTIIGYLTQNKTTAEWHTVFSIQTGISLFGAVIYGIFGSGELQPWAAEGNVAVPETVV